MLMKKIMCFFCLSIAGNLCAQAMDDATGLILEKLETIEKNFARLKTVESENQALNSLLQQKQKELEQVTTEKNQLQKTIKEKHENEKRHKIGVIVACILIVGFNLYVQKK